MLRSWRFLHGDLVIAIGYVVGRNSSKVTRLIEVAKVAYVLLVVGGLGVIAQQSSDLPRVEGISSNWIQEQDCKAMRYLPSMITINQPAGREHKLRSV